MMTVAVAVALSSLFAAATKPSPPPAPPAPKPLRFSCPEALADGTLVDPRQAGALAALAAGLKWDAGDQFGPPTDCHREVRLICGPDLDHDGDPDAIVEVSWWFTDSCAGAAQDGEFVPVTKTFLASRRGGLWRGVAALGVASSDEAAGALATGAAAGQSVAPPIRRSYFVRRPRGETAIRVEWSNVASETGCSLGGYEIFALRAGVLRKVEANDNSQICAPCGCNGDP
jgi:hypothetical protein